MARRLLERRQLLPITPTEAWDFFSLPANLLPITPPGMGLRPKEPLDGTRCREGLTIRYSVRPLPGITLTWVSLIEQVEPPRRFVDVQLKGPFKRWSHEHTFEAVDGGVLMRDRVDYELPWGVLGDLAHHGFVRRRLEHVFGFRAATLERLFRTVWA